MPYAIVKNIGEAYFRSYFQIYNLEYTIFRFFNTYGPNQSTDFVIPKLLKLALNNIDIKIYGKENYFTDQFSRVNKELTKLLVKYGVINFKNCLEKY